MPTISSSLANFLFDLSNVVLSVGAAAVLLGTLGVVWMGSVKERYSDERIAVNEAETAKANKEAAEANERAGKANERAGWLEKDAAEARLKQENLQKSNLELQKSIEGERTARTKLQAALSSRHISREQHSTIIKVLQTVSGQPIKMLMAADTEANTYAKEIAQACSDGGFRISANSIGQMVAPLNGLILQSHSNSILVQAFRKANIEFELVIAPDNEDKILVGLKPPAL